MSKKTRCLEGIIPPLVTPLLQAGKLDECGLEWLVNRAVAGGVDALFLLGTTGESASLTLTLKKQFTNSALRLLTGRLPAVVNVTATAVEEVVELAECASAAGATALALGPPFYFQLNQQELASYFERVIPRLPLPVYLYNFPQIFKIAIDLQTVTRLRELPQVIGLKDSSGDMTYFAALRNSFPQGSGFGLYCGPEELLDKALKLGADGAIAGGANLFPSLYAELFAAHRRGEERAVGELQALVLEVSQGIYSFAGGSAGVIKGIKCALRQFGLPSACAAEPLGELSHEVCMTITKNAIRLEERLMERVR